MDHVNLKAFLANEEFSQRISDLNFVIDYEDASGRLG